MLQTQLQHTTWKIITKYSKIKLVLYYEKIENKYDPKIETVWYLELIYQHSIWIIFNTASKVCKFTVHASSHSIYTKCWVSKVQTLNFINPKFVKNYSFIGVVDTYYLQSIAILFNLTVDYNTVEPHYLIMLSIMSKFNFNLPLARHSKCFYSLNTNSPTTPEFLAEDPVERQHGIGILGRRWGTPRWEYDHMRRRNGMCSNTGQKADSPL